MKAVSSLSIDRWHPNKQGACAVSIRVTFQGKRRYYNTGVQLSNENFDQIMNAKRRNKVDNEVYQKITKLEVKAHDVIKSLPAFSFEKFERIFLENEGAVDSVTSAFNDYIKELKAEGRIGTAVSYDNAKVSFNKFQPGLTFSDITKSLLTQYEKWMLDNGKSKATIGIYTRSLRTIFNRANIDRSLYPFGDGRDKYSIPSGRNFKKALSIEEIAQIFNYKPAPGSAEEMAKDYWIFVYLCNGLNIKDLCRLKRKDIDGNVLTYERAKTSRSKRGADKIVISLKPEAKTIITKWGQHSISPYNYLFPHLNKSMSPEIERAVIQQLIKLINKNMKGIARKLSIEKPITTYYARHSFATILKRSGASTEFISEALGHSDMKTTKNYLASFEAEAIHKTTDALTAFPKAN